MLRDETVHLVAEIFCGDLVFVGYGKLAQGYLPHPVGLDAYGDVDKFGAVFVGSVDGGGVQKGLQLVGEVHV